ncbi:MAG: twitching motility protein PilT [Anaerolineales bacterium]|nr:twitching motility protein PilT [Anaerolineales bacterium]
MVATFRFYAELNDFLPPSRRFVSFKHTFRGNPSVKDTIEALGVPHTEIDLILVNGESVDFTFKLHDGDRVSVYPIFESIDITPLVRVRPEPLREIRFVLDTHLGRLASYLRMLGFDTLYNNECDDESLARIASEEMRILLTKDRGLLKRNMVTHGYCVRGKHPREKLVEVIRRFDLGELAQPFHRCIRCNGLMEDATKDEVLDSLPPRVAEAHNEFRRCGSCYQVYWKGSHYDRMQQFLDHVLREGRSASYPRLNSSTF